MQNRKQGRIIRRVVLRVFSCGPRPVGAVKFVIIFVQSWPRLSSEKGIVDAFQR